MADRPLRAVGESKPRDLLKDFDDNKGFNEFGFYCATSDKRGHKEQINLKVPDGQVRAIWEVVNAFDEYKSVQDFIRDAIIHHMHKRNGQIGSPSIERRVNIEVSVSNSQRLMAEMRDMRESMELNSEVLKQAYDAGDWMLMQEAIEMGYEAAEEMREPYKGQMRAEIVKWKEKLKRELDKGLSD